MKSRHFRALITDLMKGRIYLPFIPGLSFFFPLFFLFFLFFSLPLKNGRIRIDGAMIKHSPDSLLDKFICARVVLPEMISSDRINTDAQVFYHSSGHQIVHLTPPILRFIFDPKIVQDRFEVILHQ